MVNCARSVSPSRGVFVLTFISFGSDVVLVLVLVLVLVEDRAAVICSEEDWSCCVRCSVVCATRSRDAMWLSSCSVMTGTGTVPR